MQMSMPPMGQQPFQQGFQHMGQVGQFGFGHIGQMGNAAGSSGLAPGMGMTQDPRVLSKPSELLLPTPVPPPDLSPAVEQPRSGDNGNVFNYFHLYRCIIIIIFALNLIHEYFINCYFRI